MGRHVRLLASEWDERYGDLTAASVIHWRKVAAAERKRGELLECEIGDLRREVNLLRCEASQRLMPYVANLV